MAATPRDYLWIRGAMWFVELQSGPFWKPPRPQPPVSMEDLLSSAHVTEEMLRRLILGRKRSVGLILGVVPVWLLSFAMSVLGGPVIQALGSAVYLALIVVMALVWFR